MRPRAMWWLVPACAVALAAAAWGPIASNVERPKYKLIARDKDIEIRDYAPMLAAETEVAGKREEAIREGFRGLADYIFGNNVSAKKVAMTAPVTQQASERIAMTAPVTQKRAGANWEVRFIMPAGYTIESVPIPKNPTVRLRQLKQRRFAVIRFSGFAGEESLRRHAAALNEYLRSENLLPMSEPIYAFYNPPWTLPFLRRNEVMIEIGRGVVGQQ